MTELRPIAEVVEDLRRAEKQMHERRSEEQAASSASTSALNEVNRLQAELDAIMKAMKKNAARETDWHRQMNPPTRIGG